MNLIYDISLKFDVTINKLVSTFYMSSKESNAKLLLDTFFKQMSLFTTNGPSDIELKRSKERIILNDNNLCKNSDFLSLFYGNQLIFYKEAVSYEKCKEMINNASSGELLKLIKKILIN